MGIFDRVADLAGTEWAQMSNLAHETFQMRIGEHQHTGRALVETVAMVARNHPNLFGVGAGFLVERLLVVEKHRFDAASAAQSGDGAPQGQGASPPAIVTADPMSSMPTAGLKLSKLRPAKIAGEVFAGLILLKVAATGVHWFRSKHQAEIWFGPAARIRLFSATFAAYQLAKALRSPKVSALRNASILFFGTNALKPLLRPSRKDMAQAARARAAAAAMPPRAAASPPALPESPPAETTPAAPIAPPPVSSIAEQPAFSIH